MDNKRYFTEGCYPTVEKSCCRIQNRCDLNRLYNLYGGKCGIVTAAMQYRYNSFALATDKIYWAAEEFKNLSDAKLYHMGLLADAIFSLGGNPELCRNTCWNGCFLNYSGNPCGICRKAAAYEDFLKQQFLKAAECTENYSIKKLLTHIGADTARHTEILKNIYSELGCEDSGCKNCRCKCKNL